MNLYNWGIFIVILHWKYCWSFVLPIAELVALKYDYTAIQSPGNYKDWILGPFRIVLDDDLDKILLIPEHSQSCLQTPGKETPEPVVARSWLVQAPVDLQSNWTALP